MNTADILRSITYFSDLPAELLSDVCDASEQIRLAPGDVIIREGEEIDEKAESGTANHDDVKTILNALTNNIEFNLFGK